MLRTRPSVCAMRSCVLTLCLLGGFVLNSFAGPARAPKIEVKEITVRVENSSLGYPDSLVLLPGDFPDDQRQQLFQQLRHDVTDNQLTSEGGLDDVSEAVETVLRAAELELKGNHNGALEKKSLRNAKEESTSVLVYVVEPEEPKSVSRHRRSSRLVRSAYTKQWQDLCDSCPALAPQQPVIINIIKTGSDCGNNCTPKPNSCGFPQCDSQFPHHPFMFHHPPPPPPPPHFHHHPPPPPPPPPPHFHHYPPPPMFHPQPVFYTPSVPAQPTVNIPKPVSQEPAAVPQQPAARPQQPAARPQVSPPVNQCDPCAAPPNQQPLASSYSGGSFSQSSASAQSSAFAWNG